MMQGMECSRACYLEDGPPDVFDLTTPVARKAHKCCECGETINKGDQYQRVFGVWEGDATTFKTCLTCSRIAKDFCCNFGNLRQELWEILGVDYLTGRTQDDE